MAQQVLALFGSAALLLWFCRAIFKKFTSPLKKVPGPWYTLLSDIWLMRNEFTAKRRQYIHHLHERYGPVVRLGPNEISFISQEALKEIYTSGGSGYDKTEFYTLFMQFNVRTMFSTLGKGDHSLKKRYIAGRYANTNVKHPEVIRGIEERSAAFLKKCTEVGANDLDVYVYLHCYALDCAAHHLFHPHGTHSIERDDDMKMMEEQSYHNSIIQNFANYRWPSLSTLVDRIMKPRPSPIANEYVLTCTQKLDLGEQTLLHRLQNSNDSFSTIQAAAECMDHLAAGIDTTGDALCLLMYQLSRPESLEVQDKLFAEFHECKSKALDELPYLDAVIKEGLRCFPPIPMSQPRYVPSGGRKIDGYFIPAGTIVSCQAWSVHQLNEEVFSNGDQFMPDRWLDEKKVFEMNRLFFAFGAGGRGCVGRHLAMAEMRCLLRDVYSRFKTRIAPNMNGKMTMSDQIISSRPLDQTCKLVFEPRS